MATIKTNWMIASITSIIVLFSGFAVSANNSEKSKEETKKEVTAPAFLVNKGAEFSPRSAVNPSQNCLQANPRNCAYQTTEEGMGNIPSQDSYTPAQIDEYASNGWITPHPQSGLALYQN